VWNSQSAHRVRLNTTARSFRPFVNVAVAANA